MLVLDEKKKKKKKKKTKEDVRIVCCEIEKRMRQASKQPSTTEGASGSTRDVGL